MSFPRYLPIFALVVFSPITALADDPSPAEALSEILNTGWQNGDDAWYQAVEMQSIAERTWPSRGEFDLALAMVAFQHRKFNDAPPLLESAIAKDGQDMAARRAAVWLEVFLKHDEAAIVKLSCLAAALDEAERNGVDEDELREPARLLGRLAGFLESPRDQAILLNDARLEERLSPFLRAEYEAGRQEVHDKFARFNADIAEEETAGMEAARAEREAQAADAIERRASIETERVLLAEQADAAREQTERDVSELDSVIAPLRRRYDSLLSEAAVHSRHIAGIQHQIAHLRTDAAGQQDEVERDRLLRRASDLEHRELRREFSRLAPIQREGRRVEAELSQLVRQRAATIGAYEQEISGYERRRNVLVRTETLLDRAERDLDRPLRGNTSAVTALVSHRDALTSYTRFPLEAERQRLLEIANP